MSFDKIPHDGTCNKIREMLYSYLLKSYIRFYSYLLFEEAYTKGEAVWPNPDVATIPDN
jgi:hypothetical protein